MNPYPKAPFPFRHIAYSFQGGGALGAYHVGVAEALHEANYYPEWLMGTSMGAINASIIAGNKLENRISKLKEFWNTIIRHDYHDFARWLNVNKDVYARRLYNQWHALSALLYGQPGFFEPRFPNPFFNISDKKPDELSFYNTSLLRSTLEKFIDFRLINRGKPRLSLGAMEVEHGVQVFFDNTKQVIGPEHVMASAALPPGFPAIEIDGKYYWDGALSSNTPVSEVFKNGAFNRTLCFMVHLFDSYGLLPKNIDDIFRRKKDIELASRYFHLVRDYREAHSLRFAIAQLAKLIPLEKRHDPRIKRLLKKGREHTLALVRFQKHGHPADISGKDYEFSPLSISEYMQEGYQDAKAAIERSPWLGGIPENMGIALYDMSKVSTTEE
jgi:NTE family protein